MIDIDLLSIGRAFWPGMANHLWQSTLFAAVAWVIALLLKKNRARIRYWIWFSVTIKFLVPFSLITGLGGLMAPEWIKAPVETSPGWNVIQTINQPFNLPEPELLSPAVEIMETSSLSEKMPYIILSLWICGSLALLINWHRRVMRMSRITGKAARLTDNQGVESFHKVKQKNRISAAVQLASTEDMMEPGVYGIFRPVLLLSAGILDHVSDSELEAILLHEFEHIRCRDNLTSFIHMLVQSLFWFHPVVWWTGSRLVFERELACDEAVLQSGKNPQAYAEGILKVCEYYFEAPMVCVSGVIGSDLKKRVEGIMKNRTGHNLGPAKKLLLSVAGISVLAVPLLFGIINAPARASAPDRAQDEMKAVEYPPETHPASSRPEMNNESLEIANEEQNNLRAILNENTKLRTESSNEPELKDKGPAIVMANANIKSVEKHEKKSESFKAVQKTVLNDRAEKGIISPQKVSTVKESPGKGGALQTGGLGLKREDPAQYISSGVSDMRKGQIKEAVIDFSKAIDIDPGNAIAYVARGSAYFWLGRYDNAVSDYNKAIEIDPALAAAYQNRGSAYYRQGRFDEALFDYNKAIGINPALAPAYQDRGTIYLGRGRFDDAIADYSKALNLNPYDSESHNYRGVAYYSQAQYKNALNDFNRAIDLDSGYVSAYINRAANYHSIKEYDNATADYKKALELDPKNPLSEKMKDYCRWADAGKRRSLQGNSILQNRQYNSGVGGPTEEARLAFDNLARNK